MIEVFKTNITDTMTADHIARELTELFPNSKINFDLEDCDHILRVENPENVFEKIAIRMKTLGYVCEVLES